MAEIQTSRCFSMSRLALLVFFTCLCFSRRSQGHSTPIESLQRSGPICGALLAALTGRCASVKHSTLVSCCSALKAWNDGLCWCDENAFKTASNLAMDSFAFQFRATTCNITAPFRPDVSLPVASKRKLRNTCPFKISTEGHSIVSESCEGSVSGGSLRKSRVNTLERLSDMNVFREADISKWSMDLDAIFVPEALLFSIGMSFSFPRVNVKKTLLTRSTLYDGVPWRSNITRKSLVWRSSNSVSYTTEASYGPFAYSRVEFVLFENCSPRITRLFAQEEEGVRLFGQFVYLDPSDRILWRVKRSSVTWCRIILKICGHDLFPFRDLEKCLKVYRKFRSGRVSCSAQSGLSSVTALHGNTLACRNKYLGLAQLNRERYCPYLGGKGVGLCRERGCPRKWYDDIFTTTNPRFDSSIAYKCSSTDCSEDWPVEERDLQSDEDNCNDQG